MNLADNNNLIIDDPEDIHKAMLKILELAQTSASQNRIEHLLKLIHMDILKMRYQHKTAFTLKEVSDSTGINIKSINRYLRKGKIKGKRDIGSTKVIVLYEDLINFLTALPDYK